MHPLSRRFNSGGLYSFSLATLLFAAPSITLACDDLEYQRDIKPILTKYCVGCHNEKDNDSEIQLQSLANIRKGGPKGPLVVANMPNESHLIRVIRGADQPSMPPKDSPQLSEGDIEKLARWIQQGAVGSDEVLALKYRIKTSNPPPKLSGEKPVTALAQIGNSQWLGRFNAVYRQQDQWSQPLPFEIVGKVTQIRSTRDGKFTVIASGIPGVGGQATILENQSHSSTPKWVRVVEGHQDILYSAVLSPNGKTLATAGYDREISLWNVADGQLLRRLTGHNGAVYDLDFDATGQVIASASADETIKIWRVDSGERLDTFGQCEAEQHVVRFDSARNRVLAAGGDRRVRVWKLLSLEKPAVSPMLYSTFAHEGPVTHMAISNDNHFIATASDDKKIKLWDAESTAPLGQIGTIDEVPTGLIWNTNQSSLSVSTLGGKVMQLDASKMIATSNTKSTAYELEKQSAKWFESPSELVRIDENIETHSIANPQELSGPTEVKALLTYADMQGEYAGDWYAFEAKAGIPWVIEIDSSRSGSPMDSVIDILDAKGGPMVRTRLQAVRESYFTFRGKDSTIADDFRMHRWEDMELNELLYVGGEVVKLWLYPRGPDSGFKVYPGFGSRFTYFDTTATTHALNEPAWIVRELADGEPPVLNGLPVFPIYYTNDDESTRQLGKDSQITFRAKTDGRYLIRVRDTRGQSGDKYQYKLTLRHPLPRYKLRAEQKEITLRRGVGTEFEIAVNRFEGCDGDIDIAVEGLPEGILFSSPLVIQAGQHRAVGSLFLTEKFASNVKEFTLQLSSHSMLGDRKLTDGVQVPLLVKVSDKPAMHLRIVGKDHASEAAQIAELQIKPGQTISANLVIETRRTKRGYFVRRRRQRSQFASRMLRRQYRIERSTDSRRPIGPRVLHHRGTLGGAAIAIVPSSSESRWQSNDDAGANQCREVA